MPLLLTMWSFCNDINAFGSQLKSSGRIKIFKMNKDLRLGPRRLSLVCVEELFLPSLLIMMLGRHHQGIVR